MFSDVDELILCIVNNTLSYILNTLTFLY